MADSKLTALTEETTPADADLMYLVDDVAGTPTSKRITWANIKAAVRSALVSDTAYGSGWNGDTTTAPSKNAVYDKIEAISSFKFITRRGAGNYTGLNSTSFVAIDSTNLGYLTFDLAVGEVVRCEFQAEGFMDSGNAIGFDVEVDRPTSANVFASGGNDYGVVNRQIDGVRGTLTFFCYFTATEAGVHGFRPCYKVSAGNLTIGNATSGTSETDIIWAVERKGVPTA